MPVTNFVIRKLMYRHLRENLPLTDFIITKLIQWWYNDNAQNGKKNVSASDTARSFDYKRTIHI